MILENLSESLKNTLNKIAKSIFVDEKLVNEKFDATSELKLPLLINKLFYFLHPL